MADPAKVPSFDELVRQSAPIAVPAAQRADLEALRRRLAELQGRAGADRQYAFVGVSGEPIPVPESLFVVMARAVEFMARGDAVNVVPTGQELTTQQAADILNVSRQYVVRLVNEGRIPCTKTGAHRRLRVEDVLAFKAQRDRERGAGLDALTQLTEELGGYGELE